MTLTYLDTETYSAVDLKKAGMYRYAADPSTILLLVCYAFDDGDVQTWTPCLGEPIPFDLAEALASEGFLKKAHNAPFERTLLRREYDIGPISSWQCTMAHANTLALPADLDRLCSALGVQATEAKMAAQGKRLVKLFCTPQKPTKKRPQGGRVLPHEKPQEWAEFVEYCVRDVKALRAVDKKMAAWPMPAHEWRIWQLDQEINDNGLPIDTAMVDAALDVAAKEAERLFARAQEITGLENPNARDQIMEWLEEEGAPLPNLQAKTVADALKARTQSDEGDSEIAEILEIRQELSKTSVKKFGKMKASVVDGRARGCYQYAGAGRTWRWAGRGVQPQNLPRGNLFHDKRPFDEQAAIAREALLTRDPALIRLCYGSVFDFLTSLLRPTIAAPDGLKLVAADFSSVEYLMLGWAANCKRILDNCAKGIDPYKDFATFFFGVPFEAVTKKQRQDSKPPVLGCGYYLGAKGLIEYATQYDVKLTPEQSQSAVDTYREIYWEVPLFWRKVDAGARHAINHGSADVGAFHFERDRAGDWLFIHLPSGRKLAYRQPRIARSSKFPEKDAISYVGIDGYTHQWCRIETHPGKITENIVQAISRDLQAPGLLNAKAAGFNDICGHTHDEIKALAKADDDEALDRLIGAMTQVPRWCAGLPLRATGWEGRHYRKD